MPSKAFKAPIPETRALGAIKIISPWLLRIMPSTCRLPGTWPLAAKRKRLRAAFDSTKPSVLATKPAVSTTAPAPTTMPDGLTKITRPFEPSVPNICDGLLVTT